MASLCKGGDEPPGSLKNQLVSIFHGRFVLFTVADATAGQPQQQLRRIGYSTSATATVGLKAMQTLIYTIQKTSEGIDSPGFSSCLCNKQFLQKGATKLRLDGETVGQVAQAARRLTTGWMVRVRSRVSEGWRVFFIPSCPDWSWGPLNLL